MLTLTTRARAGRRTGEDSHAMVQTLVAIGLLCLTTLALLAAPVPTGKPGNYPAWWFSRNVIAQKNPTNASPAWPANYPTADDFSGINQGQLKNLATAAYNELRAQAPTNVWTTPQGTNLTALVTGWNPASGDAYAGVNLGQLKTVAKPFYDVLVQIGYTGAYPWTGVNADDYSAANIGQAKYAFSFDVTAAPLAVTGLTVTAAVNELDLAWTDPPYNPMENLTVLQSTDGGSTWTAIATLSPGATSFAAPNLDPNLSYSYKISSNRNTSGGSASTASTTPAPPISLPRYALIDLGTNMYPVAMNSNCDVVGGTNLWSQGTNYNLSGGSFTGVVWASGIDDSGHMVGNNGSGAGGNPQVVYWASKTSAPSGLGTNMVWPGSDGSYPFGGISLNGCMGGDGSIVGEMDAAGASIIATFTNGGSPAYFWSPGGTNGAYGYFARPASKARGHWAGWYLDGFSSTSGAVVDGTEYPGKTAYAVNDSGVAVGTDTPYAPGNAIIFGSTPTVLGPGTALALNNATVMSGTNTVAQPQIVGYDASGNPILWDHTNPDGTTSSSYVAKKINSLCPTHSGWTVTGAAAINNAGCIAGSANYSGTNSAIPQGQHGCLLIPIQITPQTIPTTGVARAKLVFGSGVQVPVIPQSNTTFAITVGGQNCTNIHQDENNPNIFYFTVPPGTAGSANVAISGVNVPGMPWLSATPPQTMTLPSLLQYTGDSVKGMQGFSDSNVISIDEAKSTIDWQVQHGGISAAQAPEIFDGLRSSCADLQIALFDQFFENQAPALGDLNNFQQQADQELARFDAAYPPPNTTSGSGSGVSLTASVPQAYEAGPVSGMFTVARPSATNQPLTVNYTIGGTAANGTDYTTLSGSVVIPANQTSAQIVVAPIQHALGGDKTVLLTLSSSTNYTINSNYSADTVTIYNYGDGLTSNTIQKKSANLVAVNQPPQMRLGDLFLNQFFLDSGMHHLVNPSALAMLMIGQTSPPPLPQLGSATFFTDVQSRLTATGGKMFYAHSIALPSGPTPINCYVFSADNYKLSTYAATAEGHVIDNAVADNPNASIIINGALFNFHTYDNTWKTWIRSFWWGPGAPEPFATTGVVIHNGSILSTSSNSAKGSWNSVLGRYYIGQSSAPNNGQAQSYQFGHDDANTPNASTTPEALSGLISCIVPPHHAQTKTDDIDLGVYHSMIHGSISPYNIVGVNRATGILFVLCKGYVRGNLSDVQAQLVASGVDYALLTDGGGSNACWSKTEGYVYRGWRQTAPINDSETVTSYLIFSPSH